MIITLVLTTTLTQILTVTLTITLTLTIDLTPTTSLTLTITLIVTINLTNIYTILILNGTAYIQYLYQQWYRRPNICGIVSTQIMIKFLMHWNHNCNFCMNYRFNIEFNVFSFDFNSWKDVFGRWVVEIQHMINGNKSWFLGTCKVKKPTNRYPDKLIKIQYANRELETNLEFGLGSIFGNLQITVPSTVYSPLAYTLAVSTPAAIINTQLPVNLLFTH